MPAFKARTFGGTLTDMVGGGPVMTFGKYVVTGKIQTFDGEPTEEMLASNAVLVMDMHGVPYPESCADRKGTKPRQQALAKMDGRWPTARELKLQAVASAKVRDPLEAGVQIEMARDPTLTREQAAKRVQMRLLPNVDIPEITTPARKSA